MYDLGSRSILSPFLIVDKTRRFSQNVVFTYNMSFMTSLN